MPAPAPIAKPTTKPTPVRPPAAASPSSTSRTPAGKAPTGDTAPGVMELKGLSSFTPPTPIAEFLDARKQSTVNVRFGDLAQGPLQVKTISKGKYQAKHQPLPLPHAAFARVAEYTPGLAPSLVIGVVDGKIVGRVGLAANEKVERLEGYLQKTPEILGLLGLTIPTLPTIINGIEGGSLHLGLKGVPIKLGSAFSGTFSFEVMDKAVTFEGNAAVNVKGLSNGTLDLKRATDGAITGKVAVGLTLPKNFSGSIDVAWDGIAITGMGKVGYKGEKFSGEVTLYLMEKNQAVQLGESKKAAEGAAPPSGAKAGDKKPAKIDYVVFGEGDLGFSFTEWLNGTAHVIVDPKGNVTVIGKITPQKEFILFEQKDYVKQLFKLEARASYGIPVVGNIFIFANIGMDLFAKLGPAKFYNIVIDGTYSTDPKVAQNFSIRGSLNISAAAGARLRAEAGAGLEILSHDIKAGAGLNGIAAVKAYAEATPTVGYREKAAEGQDKKGEWFIRGDLEVAAQPFLGLSGDLFVEIDAPWWSPVPDKKWTWPLFGKEWPLGGTMGMLVSVDYVFGSGQWPKFDFKPVEFDSSKLMTNLYEDKAKSGSGKEVEQKGKWQEKNSKAADPPPKTSAKGNASPGKPAVLPAAKSKPVSSKKSGKPADPNAKTKEGKSVKQLQDEATKKGKKPTGGEIKAGAGKEGTAEKGKGKQANDEETKQALAALEQVTTRYAKDGATKEEVITGVKAVRRKFSKVFKSIEVIDGGDTWDFEYEMSPATKKKGPKKSSQTGTAAKNTAVSRKTGTLATDTVGTYMLIDWLDANYPIKHPGSPPKSGVQSKLMNLLETDPGEKSPFKFVRGHLLNEHLGGEGEAVNLFPITGNANSQHLHSTETKVKNWIKGPNQWVRYEVKVGAIKSKLDSNNIEENYVNCTLSCDVELKDESGKKKDGFKSSIDSTYKEKKKASVKE